ncbi:unnamed protein product [Dovyalis caffra]|uniref:Uncharacterized protein n=1 Tax=Dovyalis caffra TaxID=77055 RepID=A0AAV1SHS2_9ROSI|nr:unnamed protein product [Dovyalis caffra]
MAEQLRYREQEEEPVDVFFTCQKYHKQPTTEEPVCINPDQILTDFTPFQTIHTSYDSGNSVLRRALTLDLFLGEKNTALRVKKAKKQSAPTGHHLLPPLVLQPMPSSTNKAGMHGYVDGQNLGLLMHLNMSSAFLEMLANMTMK